MVAMQLERYDSMPPTQRYLIRLDPETETLGQMLKRLRDERDLKQEELAALLDPERAGDYRAVKNMQSQLSKLESDAMKRPDNFLLEKLERFYGLAPDTLILAASHTDRKRRRTETLGIVDNGDVEALRAFSKWVQETGDPVDGDSFEERIINYANLLKQRRQGS